MTSRTNVRPRPLDLSKQLPIIRDIAGLDAPLDGAKDVLYTVEVQDFTIQAKAETICM